MRVRYHHYVLACALRVRGGCPVPEKMMRAFNNEISSFFLLLLLLLLLLILLLLWGLVVVSEVGAQL